MNTNGAGKLLICFQCKANPSVIVSCMVGHEDLFGGPVEQELCHSCLAMQQRAAQHNNEHIVKILEEIKAIAFQTYK